MIKCDSCGKDNIEISKFCNQCGNKLSPNAEIEQENASLKQPAQQTTSENFVTVIDLPELGSQGNDNAVFSDIPVIGSESKQSENDASEPVSNNADNNAAGAGLVKSAGNETKVKLILERGEHTNKEFHLVTDVSYIGRWDADNGIFPDVDLDIHDPDAKVSRKHARLINKGGKFYIEDLGSTNGTFVNRGRRLLPGTPHEIESGDEIIVGKTFLRFTVT